MIANILMLCLLPFMLIGYLCAITQAGFSAGHATAMKMLERTAERETGGAA